MSYPRSLDDYTTEELLEEIDRRIGNEVQQLCPYCNHSLESHQCKYRDKVEQYHSIVAVRGWYDDTNKSLDGFDFELANCEDNLLREIADPKMRRLDIARTYWMALRSSESGSIDWKKVNKAIMDRWSFSALTRIKTAAHKSTPPDNL